LQTIENFEIICVDDGSTDDSSKILSEYRERYLDFSSVVQKNQGPGAARNRGMSEASGKYFLFLDSDDFIESTMLEKAFFKARETDADVTIFDGWILDQTSQEISGPAHYLNHGFLPDLEIFNFRDVDRSVFRVTNPAPWNKLFKSSFIKENDLTFQTLPNCEDISFTYSALALAKRITTLDQRLITYRTNNDASISANLNKSDSSAIAAICGLYDTLKKNDMLHHFIDDLLVLVAQQANYYIGISISHRQQEKLIREIVEQNWIYHGLVVNQVELAQKYPGEKKRIDSLIDTINKFGLIRER